jgi:hypothetical protein
MDNNLKNNSKIFLIFENNWFWDELITYIYFYRGDEG